MVENITYIGETLWLGQLGHFSILLGFCAAILATIAYSFAARSDVHTSWTSIGRYAFATHGVAIFTLIAVLFSIMIGRHYEYYYAYEHVSDDLPMRYIFSAFWEGQEGSFLLWMFWHIVLGFILIFKSGKWEAPVLATLCLIEVVINSMILGLHVEIGDFSYKIGSNPTLLLRDTMNIPIFQNADYLQLVTGTGLNPLLQNYWMTIHPPTLFLGFASTTIPFCYAVAGLATGKHKEWIHPVLNWSLFSAAILGIGILMGGAWAYEALTFGGYWAWDPVENTSLVPWIILVAGVHTNLIARATGQAIRSSYLFYIGTFSLILYSTFLTRSGILGETSVHAFTEMGLEWQLVFMVALFVLLGLGLFFWRSRSIPTPKKEEASSSREFWMFIGSLVLFFSALLITASSSLPVFNKIMTWLDPVYIGKVIDEPVPHYNKYQLWIAVLISLFSGVTIWMRYKQENLTKTLKKIAKPVAISLVAAAIITYLFTLWLELYLWQYYLLMFCSAFGVIINLLYVIMESKASLKLGASAVSHFGFSLMIIGVLASGLNSSHISSNPFAFREVFDKEDLGKYVLLYKDAPLFMNGYWVTYQDDTIVGNQKFFNINIEKKDTNNLVIESFDIAPTAVYANDFSKVAAFNPSTRRYFDKDIFSNVLLPKHQMDVKFAEEMEDTLNFVSHTAQIGDSLYFERSKAYLRRIIFDPLQDSFALNSELSVGIEMQVIDEKLDTQFIITPSLALNNNLVYNYPEKVERFNTIYRVNEKFFDEIFTPDKDLEYKTIRLKQAEQVSIDGYDIKLNFFETDVQHPAYEKQEGDIAVMANVNVSYKGGDAYVHNPVYVIRQNRPFSIKSYDPESGTHIRLANIDPQSSSFTIKVASDDRSGSYEIPIEVAENVPRTDLVIFEARIFPGINLFWSGSIFMMLGFILALLARFNNKAKKD